MSDFALVDDEFLGDLDEIRGIGGELGLRPFTVSVSFVTWSGARVGMGTPTTTTTTFTNTSPTPDVTTQPVMVRQVNRKEVIASGGLYTNRDLKVGPLTPAFAATLVQAGGGFADPAIDPEATNTPTEVHWRVSGPGYPAAGATFDKVGEEATSLHYYVIIRQAAHQGT